MISEQPYPEFNGISVLFLLSGEKEDDLGTLRMLQKQTAFGQPLQIVAGYAGDQPDYFREHLEGCAGELFVPGAQRSELYNRFLACAKGRLLTVADGGDSFADDYFHSAADLYEKQEEPPVLLMTKKGFYFHGVRYPTPFVTPRVEKDVMLIDLEERADCSLIPLFFAGTFLRTDTAKQYPMRPKLGLEAEKEMFLRLSLEHTVFLYINNLEYHYRAAQDSHYIIFHGVYQREWYYDSFREFLIPFLENVKAERGRIPRYLQYVTLYCVCSRLVANRDNRNKRVIAEDGETYLRSLHAVLAYVDMDVLANVYDCTTYPTMIPLHLLLYRIKKDRYYYEDLPFAYQAKDGEIAALLDDVPFFTTKNVEMNIQFIEYRDGRWEIDCVTESLLPLQDARYYIRMNGKRYELRPEERFSLTCYFGVSAYKRMAFHASVPFQKDKDRQKLQFFVSCAGQEVQLRLTFLWSTSRISEEARYSYWRFDRYLAYKSGRDIVIRRAKRLYTMYRELRVWQEWLRRKGNGDARAFVKLRILYFLTRPYFKRKRIWLFLDKIYKGGDSSEYLYKYAMTKDDGIRKYYLLDPNAADYKRLRKEGYTPLKRGSLMHKLVFLNADMVSASNSTVYPFNDYPEERVGYIKDLTHFHVVCVQHGLSVQNIARAQNRLKDNTRLYFCASKYEIENLSRPVYNYVGYDALKLTGVPRYDGLVDESRKQILLSPTWRMQSAIGVTTNEGVERAYNPYFKETPYYQVYNSLINDERLIRAAREYGYRIVYVLHPIVSPQAKDFDRNDYVEIVPSVGDMSYEKLFRESSLMVTDYSGVQFDFAYMRKPLVYLHHDAIPKHYEEGVFTYATMAFGEICHTNDELVDVLISYMKDGCRMKEKYVKRADDFFAFRDRNNCQRIYDVMLDYQHRVVDQITGRS